MKSTTVEDPSQRQEAWRAHFDASPMRFAREVGAMDAAVGNLLAAWHHAEAPARAAMLGAAAAAAKMRGLDVVAAFTSLRAVLPETEGPRCDQLLAVAVDAYVQTATAALRDAHDEQLAAMPVGLIHDMPFLFVVGEPTERVLAAVLDRWHLLAISVGAGVAIIDVSAASQTASIRGLVAAFVRDRMAGRAISVAGLPTEWLRQWQAAGAIFHTTPVFADAVTWALERRRSG